MKRRSASNSAAAVPPKWRRSLRAAEWSKKRPPSRSGAKSPEIWIETGETALGERIRAHARIQLRRAKYRYLVWWENGRKREFYLGQVKNRTPEGGSEVRGAGAHQVRTRAARRGGKKIDAA
jgi:hypothetical protein